jgi:serine/threonine protein kinase/Tol biopolymer transport system component
MTPERWQQVERIYQAVLDRNADARAGFLDEACAGDAALRAEVESLLRAHRSQDRFLESGAVHVVARNMALQIPRAAAGQRLGDYELIALLGAGGMGEVWRAFDPGLRRHIAIKILPAQYSLDPERLRRFEHEAQAAGRLNHPNVLSVYAIGQHAGSPFLVTELLEGMTLRQKLAGGALPEAKALEYADQLVQGLAAAHDKGIVHRDLKPENVFITSDERVKILDFGLAKLASTGPQHQAATRTATGVALGTPAYMAPEQVRGHAVDHRADIFALGALLYEILAGRRAFDGETSAEAMTAILHQEPPPIPGVSAHVEQIARHCLEKEPAGRYQSARDLAFQLRLARQPPSPISAPLSADRPRRAAAASLVALIVVAATAALTWWLTRPGPPAFAPTFRRLTSDSGLTTDPAFSPDGRLVAYASDRGGAGNLDIWLQQLATGEAVQLTRDAADESEPTFSPDGSRIAFRSERDGGGIWSVPAFGGEPRFVVERGRRPRFSPDGTRIAYWVSASAWYIGQAFTVSAGGGSPSPIGPGFATVMYPAWSSDGSKLLFLGARDAKDLPIGAFDWWMAPVRGDAAVQTGAVEVLRRQHITAGRGGRWLIAPDDWIGDEVFFSGGTDEHTNLWRLVVSPETGKAEGPALRITSGTSTETKASVIPGGQMAFVSATSALNIWSLPVAANRGTVNGVPQQVTSSAFDARTSVSADGRKLVFISSRLGNFDVWMKDLASGKETALTATPAREEEAEITADGTRVVYTVFDEGRGVLYQIATTGGPPEKLCDDCGRPWDWSPDGRTILYLIVEGRRGPNVALGLFDIATRRQIDYLVSPTYGVARVRFSPDGRWISFTAINNLGSHIAIAPVRREAGPREDEWISITPHRPVRQDKARWSPDGQLLYYTSDIDGFRCVWAQRLDPRTKRPVGEPLEIYHSHSVRRSLTNVDVPVFFELSLTADKLFLNMGETTGNIWTAEWRPE